MNDNNQSLSLANPNPPSLNLGQKLSLAVAVLGIAFIFITWGGLTLPNPALYLTISLTAMTLGAVAYGYFSYRKEVAGVKNNHVWFDSLTNRGTWAWIFGVVLTALYVFLYWMPSYLGKGGEDTANTGLVALFDPLSFLLKGEKASEWFVYGTLYTVAVLGMGTKFILKYRHNRYHVIRTLSVMFFQLGFAFLLPEFLMAMKEPYYDFKNMWPLNFYFFQDWSLDAMLADSSQLGWLMLTTGFLMMFLISPLLTYFYGKRWYCSWVCGCGGLAETAGDPFRHLSDKSLFAWKLERWVIHVVLALVAITSAALVYSYAYNRQGKILLGTSDVAFIVIGLMLLGIILIWTLKKYTKVFSKIIKISVTAILGFIAVMMALTFVTGSSNVFIIDTYQLKFWYGFLVAQAFAGVIGVGFYPILGNRVWCRFGCPMAAILGIQQRFFSRFRITTNGGQCISCGNCSTYCEQGIDVRWYAQRGQDIVRASCVGCGVCSAVCPRGVLRLENGGAITKRATQQRTVHVKLEDVGVL